MLTLFRCRCLHFLALLGLAACDLPRDLDDVVLPAWQPEVALPLVSTRATLAEILEERGGNLEVEVDENGFYTFVYFSTRVSDSAQALFPVPSPDATVRVGPGASGTFPAGTALPPVVGDSEIDFVFEDATVSRMVLKEGTLRLTVRSELPHNAALTLRFPTATRNGTPLTQFVLLSYEGTTPVETTETVDLSGYEVAFAGNPGVLPYELTSQVTTSGEPVAAADSIRLSLNFDALAFSRLEGRFSAEDVFRTEGDTVVVKAFDTRIDGEIFFRNPSVTITITNSLGVPVRAQVSELRTTTATGDVRFLNGSIVDSLADLPVRAPAVPGDTAHQIIRVDTTNSNARDAFQPAPNRVRLFLRGDTDPDPDGPPQFVLDTSRVRVRAETRLPAFGRVVDYRTVRFDTLDLPGAEDLDSITLRVTVENGFPAATEVQLRFLDVDSVAFDSLFATPGRVEAAPINANGRVTQPTESVFLFPFSRARYATLETLGDQIEISSFLNTVESRTRPVRIFADYTVAIRCGIVARASVDLNE